jgi:microcystin-dependent protein
MLASDINNLTFFPKGTILTFSSEAWTATSAEFKNIWKICNGQNGTPDLRNKFLRGSESSGGSDGQDSQSITLQTANLPSHSHSFTDGKTNSTSKTLTGSFSAGEQNVFASGIVSRSRSNEHGTNVADYDNDLFSIDATHSHGVTGAIGNTGSGTAFTVNTVPAYYTVIYIMKVA